MNHFGNGGPFGVGPFGVGLLNNGPLDNGLGGLDPLLDRSLFNLKSTLNPWDQMATDLNRFRQSGIGDVRGFLNTRLGQIDPRDQEYVDIQQLLNRF